jgi:hypothetical protein
MNSETPNVTKAAEFTEPVKSKRKVTAKVDGINEIPCDVLHEGQLADGTEKVIVSFVLKSSIPGNVGDKVSSAALLEKSQTTPIDIAPDSKASA